jgi:hypothetical protein
MPPGAAGVTICGCGTAGIAAGCGGSASDGRTLELAAVEMIAPAAPYAPKRSISRLFNDILSLRSNRCFIIQWVNGR